MFRQILVPLDGSKRAESALPVAACIARASGASILLVRVVPLPADYYSRFVGMSPLAAPYVYTPEMQQITEETMAGEIAAAKSYLEIIARDVLAGFTTLTEVVSGPAAASILLAAETLATDLIVMRSHGYTGYKRWAIGSVALKVARHSPVPVLILREGAGIPTNLHPEGLRPVRVLLALDGSQLSEAALAPAAQLSAALSAPVQGELRLAQVIHFHTLADGSQPGAEGLAKRLAAAEAQAYLKTVKERLLAEAPAVLNLNITTSVLANMDAANALISAAELGAGMEAGQGLPGCDVIAMATHGRSGMERWMLGSVTERVLAATKLPLLIVRPGNTKAQARDTRTASTRAAISK